MKFDHAALRELLGELCRRFPHAGIMYCVATLFLLATLVSNLLTAAGWLKENHMDLFIADLSFSLVFGWVWFIQLRKKTEQPQPSADGDIR